MYIYPLKIKNIVLYCIVLYCIVLYCLKAKHTCSRNAEKVGRGGGRGVGVTFFPQVPDRQCPFF